MDSRINELEKQVFSLQGQTKQLRRTKAELPQWMKNATVVILLGIFGQTVSSTWWASEITSKQKQLVIDVRENSDYRVSAQDKYQEIMIELSKLTLTLELLTQQNQSLLDSMHSQ